MNRYAEIKSWLDNTDRKRFSREQVEGLIAEHEALRRQNADLRLQITHWELGQDPELNQALGDILRKAQPFEVTQIAPAPLHVSDDEILFFEPVPVVILRETP